MYSLYSKKLGKVRVIGNTLAKVPQANGHGNASPIIETDNKRKDYKN